MVGHVIEFLSRLLNRGWLFLRMRLSLQLRLLGVVALSMLLILLASSYLHTVRTRSLVEKDHFENAIAQTLVLTNRISLYDYFSSLEDLRQEMQLVAGSRTDFKQIDVYQTSADGPIRLASTASGGPPLLSLNGSAGDLTDQSHPGVSAVEVTRNNSEYWLITATIKNPQHSGFIQTLVLKSSRHGLVNSLHREYNLILFGAVAGAVALLYILFNYFFRRPVREIVQAMAKTRGGALSTRAPVRRSDELGAIAQGFNRLMDDIQERSREREGLLDQISNLNSDLQQKVDQATRELRATNADLICTQQRLAYSERMAAIGQVTATLAHEIGTPLNAINGHLQLLARKYSGVPETSHRIEVIDAQLAFIVQAVRSLLERTHRRRITMSVTDINEVIQELVMLVGPMLESRHIKVTVALNSQTLNILGDRESLHQVLLNLVNNSCDAMPDGGGLEISTNYQRDDHAIEVIVSDTGTGIPQGVVAHLFEAMFTTKQSGSGLGLLIAREIISEHRGQIELVSGLPTGATFRLTLPALERLTLVGEKDEVEANAA